MTGDPVEKMRRSGWHPLLNLKIHSMGAWNLIEGFDPIDDHRSQIMIRGVFKEYHPTFIRVDDPERVICVIEQAQINEDGELQIMQARGWFGAGGIEEARIAKAARTGVVDAMRRFAQSRSYRHLGHDNRISDVASFMDIRAALYWFGIAGDRGSEEARLERAYLLDLIEQNAAYRHWRKTNLKAAPSVMPESIRNPLMGSLAHSLCIRVGELRQNRSTSKKNAAEQYLQEIARRAHSPHLGAAITNFLERMHLPPRST